MAKFVLCILLAYHASGFAQLESARPRIIEVTAHAKGVVGVAAIDLARGDTLTVHSDGHFPMQSVFKFPLALTVLARIDSGVLSLAQSVHIPRADLLPDTWSPLRDRYPSGDLDLPLDSLIAYTVSLSDNNSCDILFRLLGGTEVVNQFVHKLGIIDISIVANENEMHQAWGVQYRNWSTPLAMARLLQLFYDGKIVSRESRDYLWRLLVNSSPGPNRFRGLLPRDAVVAHKTGSSGTNEKGVAAATNDVGIFKFPDGRAVALVVFVSDSDASDEERDRVIASIARAVWDALTQNH